MEEASIVRPPEILVLFQSHQGNKKTEPPIVVDHKLRHLEFHDMFPYCCQQLLINRI